jgi:hypothetical protein
MSLIKDEKKHVIKQNVRQMRELEAWNKDTKALERQKSVEQSGKKI